MELLPEVKYFLPQGQPVEPEVIPLEAYHIKVGDCLKDTYTQEIYRIIGTEDMGGNGLWYNLQNIETSKLMRIPSSFIPKNDVPVNCPGMVFRPIPLPEAKEIPGVPAPPFKQVWEMDYKTHLPKTGEKTVPKDLPIDIKAVDRLIVESVQELAKIQKMTGGPAKDLPFQKAVIVNKARAKAAKLEHNIGVLKFVRKNPDLIFILNKALK
jgi:hypothetical protein